MPMVLLLLVYAVPVAAALAAARWLGRRVPARAALAFALLPLAFLFAGFFRGRTILPVDHARLITPWDASRPGAIRYNPNLNDAVTQFAPWAKAVRMAWGEGSLPLRDRWNACGTPLGANGQSAAFAPWTLLLFTIPLAASFNVLVAWKLFFALCGTWLWLEELGLTAVSAAFGAAAFALSFTMTPWLLFPQTSALAIFPWILFAVERLRDSQSRARAFAALVVLFTLWPLAGHVETVASFSLFGAIWLAARAVSGDFPRRREVWRPLASAALLAGGLCAFALLPQAFAIFASHRLVLAHEPVWRSVASWKPHGPVWPGLWVTLFPRSLGDSIGAPMLAEAPGSFAEVGLAYIGTIGAACVALLLRPGSPRRRSSGTLLALAVFGLAAGTALWPFAEISTLIPGLRMMFPLRWLSWTALAGSALAAFELDRLRTDLEASRRGLGALCLAIGVLGAIGVIWFARHRDAYAATGALRSHVRALALSLGALSAAFLSAAAGRWSPRIRRAVPVLLLAISLAELFWQGRRLYRFGDPRDLFPQTPLVAFLQRQERPFRVLGEGAALYPASNVFAGVEDVRTHDPVERADYVRFLDACCGYDPAAYFKQVRDVNAPALDLLSVRFLVSFPRRPAPGARWRLVYSGRDGTVFENPHARPPLFPADGPAEPLAIASYRERTNRIEIALRSGPLRPLAVRTSLVDDGGWSIRDGSGRLLEKSGASAPFLGFLLPPGESRLSLSYSPPGFFAGSAVSLAALGALFVWGISRWRRARRTRPAAPGPQSRLSRP